jgi:hypothetical protein
VEPQQVVHVEAEPADRCLGRGLPLGAPMPVIWVERSRQLGPALFSTPKRENLIYAHWLGRDRADGPAPKLSDRP